MRCLLPYHRLVAGPLPADLEDRLAALTDRYEVGPAVEACPVTQPGGSLEYVLYERGRWHRLHRRQVVTGRMGANVADESELRLCGDVAGKPDGDGLCKRGNACSHQQRNCNASPARDNALM